MSWMGRVPTSVLVALSPPGCLLGLLGWVTGCVTTTCPGRGSQRPWSVTTSCIRGVWVHDAQGVGGSNPSWPTLVTSGNAGHLCISGGARNAVRTARSTPKGNRYRLTACTYLHRGPQRHPPPLRGGVTDSNHEEVRGWADVPVGRLWVWW